MKNIEHIPFKVTTKGPLKIGFVYVHQKGKDVMAIGIDMKSKRGEVFCIGSDEKECPTIALEPVTESVNLDKRYKKNTITEVTFPTLPGWNVWSAQVFRYTACVCLVRR
jgi:hypothetical protein